MCTKNGAGRRQLFLLERGVCQLCKLDAHALYKEVLAIPEDDPAARARRLRAAGFPEKRAAAIAAQATPQEGCFWQADHIVAVHEGGGECGLDNYRTLCDTCHAKVTAAQGDKRKGQRLAEAAKGSKDIRGFFGKK